MSKKHFPESELIINADGSCFHLHLKPEQLADKVILVGDPARVDTVAAHFDSKECEVSSREFHTITGTYKSKRITCQSHGIGCDNIDIVVNELDTLANIDYNTREEKDEHRTLTMVRIGTCGGLQPFTPTGSFIASVKSIGFDGLLNYYAGRNVVCDIDMEKAFTEHMQWNPIKHPMSLLQMKSSSTRLRRMIWFVVTPSLAADSMVHKGASFVQTLLTPSRTRRLRLSNTTV